MEHVSGDKTVYKTDTRVVVYLPCFHKMCSHCACDHFERYGRKVCHECGTDVAEWARDTFKGARKAQRRRARRLNTFAISNSGHPEDDVVVRTPARAVERDAGGGCCCACASAPPQRNRRRNNRRQRR
jgi:hypothetical protein